MEIEVYDTYAQSENGSKIHFDVMLPIGGDEPTAKKKAKEFVEKISENTRPIKLVEFSFVIKKLLSQKLKRKWRRMAIALSQLKTALIPIKNDSHSLFQAFQNYLENG